ncbi:hypothetical protein Goe16_02000 [Bacillus phage vB_BsuM-Goe16]|nr:hypothetical protein Goe16_00060 [Bacillus phage vB_BsuM-Goe16]WCS68614.1 hypothetical protein Goe16_02000 [Bacillus phage vB_BsuM-Goe16]
MPVEIKHGNKTFVVDPSGDVKEGSYVLYLCEYRLGEADVGRVSEVANDGRLYLDGPGVIVTLDQPFILLKEVVEEGEEEEEYEDDRIDAEFRDDPLLRKLENTTEKLTPEETQLAQWTTTTRVFSHDLKKGIPYAIKHKDLGNISYGLYSGLLNPVTALFRHLNGESKISIEQLKSGLIEIYEVVEDEEESIWN